MSSSFVVEFFSLILLVGGALVMKASLWIPYQVSNSSCYLLLGFFMVVVIELFILFSLFSLGSFGKVYSLESFYIESLLSCLLGGLVVLGLMLFMDVFSCNYFGVCFSLSSCYSCILMVIVIMMVVFLIYPCKSFK